MRGVSAVSFFQIITRFLIRKPIFYFRGYRFQLCFYFLLHFYAFFRNSKVSCAIFLFAVDAWGENLIQFFAGVSIQDI